MVFIMDGMPISLCTHMDYFDLLKAFGDIERVESPQRSFGKDLFYIMLAQHVLSYHRIYGDPKKSFREILCSDEKSARKRSFLLRSPWKICLIIQPGSYSGFYPGGDVCLGYMTKVRFSQYHNLFISYKQFVCRCISSNIGIMGT